MADQLSREQQQKGMRQAYGWGIAAAALLTVIVIGGFVLANRSYAPSPAMEPTAKQTQQATSEEGKRALAPATVKTMQNDQFGAILADATGHPLYLFEGDQRGSGGASAASKCYDNCARSWPPLLTAGGPKAADQARQDLLATAERKDGAKQVTYNGWPLYRFTRDEGPKRGTGEGVKDYGAEWHLVTPTGTEAGNGAGNQANG